MNPIDRIIRNKLHHHTEEIPVGAWDEISKRLPNEGNKFHLIPSFLLATMSLCVLFSGLWLVSLEMTSTTIRFHQESKTIASSENVNAEIDQDCLLNGDHAKINITENSKIISIPESNIVSNVAEIKDVTRENILLSGVVSKTINQNIGLLTNHKDVGTSENMISNVDAKRSMIEVAVLDNMNSRYKLKFYRPITFKTHFNKEGKSCPFNQNLKDKSIDVYYSNDMNRKNLGLNDPLANDYLAMRHQTESSMYSFSAGVRLGYNLSYRWNLHTGINYSQVNEKFQYIDPESNQTRIITIKDYVYLNGIIVDSVVTEETVLVPGTTILKVFNKTKSIDIPILARYTLFANKNLSLSALTGVYINLKTNYEGMIIGADNNTPMEIREAKINDNEVFKSQLGISLYGGVSLAYHLTRDIDFLLEPHARVQTQSMTNEAYSLNQKTNTFGLSVGLRHKF